MIKLIDVQFEVVEHEDGYIEFSETIESAMKRVADTFGFNIKSMCAVHSLNHIGDDEGEYKWYDIDGVWYEGYFKVNTITYRFKFDYWDGFKPSLVTV